MKYLAQWRISEPSTVRTAAEHFLKTGAKPPPGATQLGRWFGLNGRGCAVLEAPDAEPPLFELVTEWREFMEVEATPVLENDDAGAILSKLYG